jgi:hypothetical protein
MRATEWGMMNMCATKPMSASKFGMMAIQKFLKLGVDKPPEVCYNKGTNEREVITMFYYEIRNTKTQKTAQATAKDFATACRSLGWKPRECRCVWKANPENAADPSQY